VESMQLTRQTPPLHTTSCAFTLVPVHAHHVSFRLAFSKLGAAADGGRGASASRILVRAKYRSGLRLSEWGDDVRTVRCHLKDRPCRMATPITAILARAAAPAPSSHQLCCGALPSQTTPPGSNQTITPNRANRPMPQAQPRQLAYRQPHRAWSRRTRTRDRK